MRLFRQRKYATKRDDSGRSARQQAFDLFAEGQRPAQVCKQLPMSLRTACRYFEDFKKQHHLVPYATIRKWTRESPEFSDRVITMLTSNLGMPREEVITRMQRPWGLLEAMQGEVRTDIEDRLMAALAVVQFADRFGHKKPCLVKETLERLMLCEGEELPVTKHPWANQ
jgi:hypothetical protein